MARNGPWSRVLAADRVRRTVRSPLNDPRGTLGTDTGGKLATLRVMERHGGLVPDIGYWAEAADPDGDAPPAVLHDRVGEQWVNVTTLPDALRLVSAVPIGGTAPSCCCRCSGRCSAPSRRVHSRAGWAAAGWTAFWAVGLASPVAIYALDFWEHSLGLALMLWGVVVVLDVIDGRAGWRGAIGAGALFGAAATMRQEALVYLAVAGTVLGVTLVVVNARFAVRSCGAAHCSLVPSRCSWPMTCWSAYRSGRRCAQAGRPARPQPPARLPGHESVKRSPRRSDSTVSKRDSTSWWAASRSRSSRTGVAPLAVPVVSRVSSAVLRSRQPRASMSFVSGGGLGFVPGVVTAAPFAAVGVFLGWKRAPVADPDRVPRRYRWFGRFSTRVVQGRNGVAAMSSCRVRCWLSSGRGRYWSSSCARGGARTLAPRHCVRRDMAVGALARRRVRVRDDPRP